MQDDKKNTEDKKPDPSVEFARSKLNQIYKSEPSAKEEISSTQDLHGSLSKHQKYLKRLSTSKRSLAEIQKAWKDYYDKLPDEQKHEVWQEFYAQRKNNNTASKKESRPKQTSEQPTPGKIEKLDKSRKPKDIRKQLIKSVTKKKQKNPHIKALTFGFSMGFLVVFILMFSFFNERFLTPFIRPSYAISGTPVITDPSNAGKVGKDPKIIIPKINVEVPVVYDEPSIADGPVQKALERGVLHYGTTPNPGELGNAVIFGHSSGNVFNKGKYKFAFMLLKSLEKDDTFTLQKDGKRYVYKVYDKFVTDPSNVSVLDTKEHKATATLITCDPPGMSTNRLVVIGEQIYPNPDTNKESKVKTQAQPTKLASDSPTLWSRMWKWLFD